jgi:hypothetical protein
VFDPTSLLLGMDSSRVVSVTTISSGAGCGSWSRRLAALTAAPAAGWCRRWGRKRPTGQVRDLTTPGQRLELWWRARRPAWGKVACGQYSFVQRSDQTRLRSRMTGRFQDHLARAVGCRTRPCLGRLRIVFGLQDGPSGAGPPQLSAGYRHRRR